MYNLVESAGVFLILVAQSEEGQEFPYRPETIHSIHPYQSYTLEVVDLGCHGFYYLLGTGKQLTYLARILEENCEHFPCFHMVRDDK